MDSSMPPQHHRKHLTNGGRACSKNVQTNHMKRDSFPVPRRSVPNPCTPPAPAPKPEQSIHPKRRSGLPPLPPRFKQSASHLSVPSPVKAVPSLSSQETVTPDSVRLRRMTERIKEMMQRLDEVIKDGEKDGGEAACAAANDVKDDLGGEDHEELVSVDWADRFIITVRCPCGKGHELLLCENNTCYYRLM